MEPSVAKFIERKSNHKPFQCIKKDTNKLLTLSEAPMPPPPLGGMDINLSDAQNGFGPPPPAEVWTF